MIPTLQFGEHPEHKSNHCAKNSKDLKWHPSKVQVVQELLEEDFASRLDFAADELQRIGEDQQQGCALDRSSGSSPSPSPSPAVDHRVRVSSPTLFFPKCNSCALQSTY